MLVFEYSAITIILYYFVVSVVQEYIHVKRCLNSSSYSVEKEDMYIPNCMGKQTTQDWAFK